MQLTDEEKAMLDGCRGEPVRKAMEILRAIGTIYGADRLIEVKSAHVAGLSYKSHGDAGLEYVQDLASEGARVVIPTTTNVIGVDRCKWRSLGLPEQWAMKQLAIMDAYERMGCYATSSCTPYYHGIVPRYGEHIAWAESSAVVFTNSVLGARDNREGGPTALASALTGRTPNYGLHLDENRRGDALFRVETPLEGMHDFGAMGAYVGRMIGERIPVFDGVPCPSLENLVALGAALASSGAVAMFHMVGVTPEAPSVEAAFRGKKHETVAIGRREILAGVEKLTSASSSDVDYVAIGCPHCSLGQLAEVARLLDGKRVRDSVRLWIHTSVPIRALAAQLGFVETIERAGGVVTQDLCTVLGNPEALGVKTLATNSAKMAFYAPGSNGLKVWYGSVERCIRAATTGRWDG